jgi:SynChlorMet cassette protein ScmC
MPRGLRLCLADETWLIRPVDEAAAAVVAELGRVMRLGAGEKGRELYAAASGEGRPPEWSGSGTSGSVVCLLPEPADPDMRAVGMDRIATAIVRESLARGGLLLHAALAEHQGRGFAMAGPSGVGKSTASSRLRPPWHSLCDDSTLVVRDRNSRWWAHPWPTWSRFLRGGPGGSWPVEHAAPLRAVFFLSQSPVDQLQPVGTTQATALTIESAVSLAWEAHRLTDEIAARSLSGCGVRAARALASAVPAYSLKTSLEGRFWDEIERVLPAEACSESNGPRAGPSPALAESLITRDSRRLVYTGASMNPTLVEPELLQVAPYRTGRVRPGDIVCFKSPDGNLTVVHRVVKVDANGIHTRGDSNRWDDERVLQPADIVGRVTAARRGSRCRPVGGGWRGLAILRCARLTRGIRSRAGSVPHKLFSLVVGFGPFGRLLPRSLRPRVVRFDARYRVFLKLLMGRLTVGQYDDRRGKWCISRPARLLVDERDLPGLGPR